MLLAPSAYYPQVGGIEELTRQLALALQARGHETAVLTNRWPDGLVESEVLGGVEVTRLRFPLPAVRLATAARFIIEAPSATRAVTHHVRNWRAEVVHVIGAGPQSVYLGMLAERIGAAFGLHDAGGAELRRARRLRTLCDAPCRFTPHRPPRPNRDGLFCVYAEESRGLRVAELPVPGDSERGRSRGIRRRERGGDGLRTIRPRSGSPGAAEGIRPPYRCVRDDRASRAEPRDRRRRI